VGVSCAKWRSNGTMTTCSTPVAWSKGIFSSGKVINRGAAPGLTTDLGWGSNVATTEADPLAPRLSASTSARCPRWTPSKLPMAIATGPNWESGSLQWTALTLS
jgi:hypothetical protein